MRKKAIIRVFKQIFRHPQITFCSPALAHGTSSGPGTKVVGLLLCLLSLSQSPAVAENYYVDMFDGDDRTAGTSPDKPWKTLRKVNKFHFRPGDIVALKRGSIWEEVLEITGAGLMDKPIIYTAYGVGDNPLIKASNTFLDWRLAGELHDKKIWMGKIRNVRNSWGSVINGVRLPSYYGYKVNSNKYSAPENILDMKELHFYAPLNGSRFYLRNDKGNPGSVEIGARSYAIHIKGARDIVVDGIDVFGPGGASDKHSGTGLAQIVVDASRRVVIKNAKQTFHNNFGIRVQNGSTEVVLENVVSYGHRSTAIYFWSAGAGNRVMNSEAHNCGTVASDSGDMGLIGIFDTPDLHIIGSYVHDNGHADITSADAAISFVRSPSGVVERTLVENVAGTGVQFAVNSNNGKLAYSIVNGWGKFAAGFLQKIHSEGIRVGGGPVESSAHGIKLYNNLVTNGISGGPGHAALRIMPNDSGRLEVKNNIFADTDSYYDIIATAPRTPPDWIFSHNLFYADRSVKIQLNKNSWSLRSIDARSGGADVFLNESQIIITENPGAIISGKAASAAIDKGVAVGQSKDYYGNAVPSGGSVDIGPYESVQQ